MPPAPAGRDACATGEEKWDAVERVPTKLVPAGLRVQVCEGGYPEKNLSFFERSALALRTYSGEIVFVTPGTDEFIPTRNSLLTRLKNWDDQEGWREFFDTYGKLIYSVGVKSGLSDAEAQDLVQETVIAVAKKMRRFKYDPAIGSFKAWLLLVTRSRIADYLRKRRSAAALETVPQTGTTGTAALEKIPDSAAPAVDAVWEEEWQKNLLEAAIRSVKSQVSARQYQIFDLYVLQQLPLRKITASLEVNAGQVYLAKHRVSKLLRQELQKLEARMT